MLYTIVNPSSNLRRKLRNWNRFTLVLVMGWVISGTEFNPSSALTVLDIEFPVILETDISMSGFIRA